MKLVANCLIIAIAFLGLGGCVAMDRNYHVAYTAFCPTGTDAEMRSKLQSLSDGVADRLQIPRPKVSDYNGVLSHSTLHGRFEAVGGADMQDIEIIFAHESYSEAVSSDITVEIRTYPNGENANVTRVRSAVEAELTRVGCGKWDFRHQVKLS